MISSAQLSALVNAAKATGENRVITQMPDGTIVEIHLRPRLEGHPLEGESPHEPILPTFPAAGLPQMPKLAPLLIQRLRKKVLLFQHQQKTNLN